MAPMHKAVIFDLDDTLVQAEESLIMAIDSVLESHGLKKPASMKIATLAGMEAADLYSRLGARSEKLQSMVRGHAKALYSLDNKVKAFPQASLVLKAVHSRGLKVGIATSRPRASSLRILTHTKLMPLVDFVVAGDEVALHKPNPAQLLACSKGLRTKPPSCIMVGDDVTDIMAGKAAGMGTVWATYGFGARQKTPVEPDYRIADIKGLLSLPLFGD